MDSKISTFHMRLVEGMNMRDMKQVDLVRATGLSKQKISQYVSGQFEAKQDGVYILAKALDVSEAWLMGFDVPMDKKQISWDETHNPDGKLALNVKRFEKIISSLPLFDLPVSAGTGAWLAEGHEYEYADFENVPHGADFALRVRGDSMEPMYSDDDIVFIRQNVMVEGGHIGVFFLNGEGYMKMLQGNKLVSLNKTYDPVTVGEDDSFFICGRVIGKATE